MYMVWLLYSDYLKESLKTATYIKYLKWYVWVIFLILLLIDVGLYITYLVYSINWLQIVMFVVSIIAGLYFGNEIRKIVTNRVGTYEDVYFNNLAILRNILERRKLYSSNQLNLLIEQIDEELPKLKTTESLIKPFYTLSTIIVIPIVTMLVKWILDSKEAEGAYLVILIFLIIIMIFSLFYMIKPLLEELLDLEYKRMSKLKQMIKDIKIIYFCQTP